jgi:glyoxalase family protein
MTPSTHVLTDVMGFRRVAEENGRLRFATGKGGPGHEADLLARPDLQAHQAAGTVHHIAWRATNDEDELAWRAHLLRSGLHVTDVRDRQYFRSIYYREPGGILYEIATDAPGFAVDEAPDSLGSALKLPPWLEGRRAAIESRLPAITAPSPWKAGAVG